MIFSKNNINRTHVCLTSSLKINQLIVEHMNCSRVSVRASSFNFFNPLKGRCGIYFLWNFIKCTTLKTVLWKYSSWTTLKNSIFKKSVKSFLHFAKKKINLNAGDMTFYCLNFNEIKNVTLMKPNETKS
jgi:hypothetical protein